MRGLRVSAVALIALLVSLVAGSASAEKRVALVIGNAKYEHAIPLANPVNDATLMAKTLREAGFEVVDGTDLDKFGMQRAVDRFTEAAFDADVGLVYYSGHGIQVDGRNYLIPVDAELTSAAHLKTRTLQAEDILASLPPDPAIGILILDACRDNPLSRSLMASLPATRSTAVGTGLAAVQAVTQGTGTGGTLIAYATDPGSVALDGRGENSPYTIALAKNLAVPGVELQSALVRVRGEVTEATLGKQRPWHNASLGREVFLGGLPPEPEPPPPPPEPAKVEEPAISPIEQIVWEEASKRNTRAHYEAYLAQFPEGAFTALARINMDQLKAAEEAAGKAAEKAAQEAAKAEEEAVRVAALAEEKSRAAAAIVEPPPPPAPKAVDGDAGTELTEAALSLDRDGRREVQERLLVLGFEVGRPDGGFGSRTRNAISAWQDESGLTATGFLTRKQLVRLKLESETLHQAYREQQREAEKQAAEERDAADKQRAASRQAEREKAAARQQEKQKAAKTQREQTKTAAKQKDRKSADKQAAVAPAQKSVSRMKACLSPSVIMVVKTYVPRDRPCPIGAREVK